MGDISTSYDAPQHCEAVKHSSNKAVFMDCPYTGRGQEFSPINLVEAALSGCMLLAMGSMAIRHDIDLSEARIETTITAADRPPLRFQSIDVQVAMPRGLSTPQRLMLERAADRCPIKHSFGPYIPLIVSYNYPD